jgi:predicted SAM-dependent methyltransferase
MLPSLIARDGKLHAVLRWGYQPVKYSIAALGELAATPKYRRRISDYLSRDGFKGLQIGTGNCAHRGWLNTDIFGSDGIKTDVKIDAGVDIEKPLPFPDSSFDAIYAAEVIEHVRREKVGPFFSEAHRVLRPNGVLRVTTPNARAVCELYLGIHDRATLREHFTTWLEAEANPEFWLNAMFRFWGHKWLWDPDSLSALMHSSKFKSIALVEPQKTRSGMKELENLDIRYGVPAPRYAWTSSMIVEASAERDLSRKW